MTLRSLVPDFIWNLQVYQAGRSIREVKDEFGLERVIKLASNENPWGPSPRALEAVQENIKNVHRYPDPAALVLRDALAKKYSLARENIIIGNGSEGIMACITRAMLRDGDEVLTSQGAFQGFPILCRTRGLDPIAIPMRDYCFDLEAIGEHINPRTKMIYLVNPNNPTGTYFTKAEFDRLMDRVPPRCLVILDEAYFEYAKMVADYPDSMNYRYDNVITLRTFSKAYGLAGHRVGYGFGHPDLIASLWKVKLPFEPGVLGQAAAIAALQDEAYLREVVEKTVAGREQLKDGLEKLGIQCLPALGNFVTMFAPPSRGSNHIFTEMLKRGVILRPLEQTGLSGLLRISVGTPEENAICLECLAEVLGHALANP